MFLLGVGGLEGVDKSCNKLSFKLKKKLSIKLLLVFTIKLFFE